MQTLYSWCERDIKIKRRGSCRFRPMASSPPYRVNLIEFVPNQIESHTEIIPRSFIHCLIRLLVAFNNSITSTQTQNFGINSNYRNFIVGANSVGVNSPWGETGIIQRRTCWLTNIVYCSKMKCPCNVGKVQVLCVAPENIHPCG